MTIWFDMDGTLVNFYGVEGWLNMLESYDPTPYRIAEPLLNMQSLARILNRLQRNGYKIGIVSWLSRNGTDEYNQAVTEVKLAWLDKHLHSVHFDYIDIIKNGIPKQNGRDGVLFDDEKPNRDNWNGIAYDVDNIIEILKGM